jgi:V8-like Glu-specific endopeptidase
MKLIFIYILIIIPFISFSQSSYFQQDEWHSSCFIDQFILDMPKTSRTIENKGGPFQYAIPYEVNRSIFQTENVKAQDGFYHYFFNVSVSEAYAINFTLKGMLKSNVDAVYVNYGEQKIDGPFVVEQSSVDLMPFPDYITDNVTIEIISKTKISKNQLFLYKIGINYDKELFHKSDECNVDINCVEGQNWQDVKQSVVRIRYDNGFRCTGTILNNTLNNERPFVLTANHCIATSQSAANAIFYFNYEAPYCDAPLNEYPAVTSNRIIGAKLRATKYDSEARYDFTLLELNDEIPESFSVHYAGWSASSTAPSNVVGIHHPGGDVKKIAIDYNELVVGSFNDEYATNSFWRILKWDVGTTEAGSSGSAIFNQRKQVVGSLTGGEASCDYPFNDYYFRFDLAFDKYSDSSQQLKYWLDPAHYNTKSWFGIPNDEIVDSLEVYVYPNPANQRFQIYSPTLEGSVKVYVYDMNGVIVWVDEFEAEEKNLFVTIPSFLTGMHYLKVETEKGVSNMKMVFY